MRWFVNLYKSRETDSARSLLTCGAAFVLYTFSLGLGYAFGILLVPIADDIADGQRGTVSWVSATGVCLATAFSWAVGMISEQYPWELICLFGLANILTGVLLTSFCTQAWQMILSYGVISGTGIAFILIPIMGASNQWFDKYRGVAVGFAVSGSGLGNLIIPPILDILTESFGWRNALRIWALITFLCTFWTIPFVTRRIDIKKEWKFSKYLRDKSFVMFWFASLIAGFAYFTPFAHISAFAEDQGVDSFLASWILASMGGSSVVGRTFLGYLGDKLGSNGHFKVFKFSVLALTLSCGLWPLATHPISLFIFAMVYGMFGGAFVATFPVLMGQRYGVENITSVLGIQFTALAFGTFLGPSITGIMFDELGSYFWAIIVATICWLCAAALIFLIPAHHPQDSYEKLPGEGPVEEREDPVEERRGEIEQSQGVSLETDKLLHE